MKQFNLFPATRGMLAIVDYIVNTYYVHTDNVQTKIHQKVGYIVMYLRRFIKNQQKNNEERVDKNINTEITHYYVVKIK